MDDGTVPLLEWFEQLTQKARAKCAVRLEQLAELGHELRRPEADFLRDDISELRAKHQNVNLRMLYFFRGRTAVVVSHGFGKQQAKVPKREIELAIKRKKAFEAAPKAHTYEGEVDWTMAKKKKKTTDLLGILQDRYFSDPEAQVGLEEARASAQVARQIRSLRTEAGLTQRELAAMVGTKHTAICRLEHDDYEGHSLSMLRRIAKALGKRVEIHFVPDPEAKSA